MKPRNTAENMVSWILRSGIVALVLVACGARDTGEYTPSKRALQLNNSAVRALAEGNATRALAMIDEVIGIEPKFYKAYANKSGILYSLGQTQEAMAALETVILIRPDYAEAYLPLGLMIEQTGDRERAVAHYEKALELCTARLDKTPDDPDAAVNRAVALFLLDQKREALKVLEEMAAARPSDQRIKTIMGMIEDNNRTAFITGLASKQTAETAIPDGEED